MHRSIREMTFTPFSFFFSCMDWPEDRDDEISRTVRSPENFCVCSYRYECIHIVCVFCGQAVMSWRGHRAKWSLAAISRWILWTSLLTEWQHFVVEAILRAPGSIALVQLNWRMPCHTGHPWSLDGADTNTHTLTLTPVYHTSTSVNPAEALRITFFVLSPLFAHTFSSFVSPDTLYRYLFAITPSLVSIVLTTAEGKVQS